MENKTDNQWIDRIEFLVGNREVLQGMKTVPVLPAFSEVAVNFLNELSKELRKDSRTKGLLDVLTYAFWIRQSSIEKEKANHYRYERRMGRGVAYHIAPSNVPVNFAVSMTSAVLAGNACVIRVSNKQFEQVDIICAAMRKVLKESCPEMTPYFAIIRYEHDDEITQNLSDLCDVRIIWGGNRTIANIRRATLPPRAIEMAFADRYSLAVINADYYLEQDCEKVAKDFYTDTYYSDQNACSSPRLVVWMGNDVKTAQERFWKELQELAHKDYNLQPIQPINKLGAFCLMAATQKEEGTVHGDIKDNFLYRIQLDKLDAEVMNYKEAGGYFMEYRAQELDEIVPILGKTCQTVAVLGVEVEEVKNLVREYGVRGVDRVMPLGKTMELSFRWDGYDMIETMSRIVDGL